MNYVKEFNEGNIGLDFKHSSEEALKELSKVSLYHNSINGQRYSVYTYAKRTDSEYKCIVYDQNYDSYNAYGAEVADHYLAIHPLMTAEQILETSGLNIDEIENDVIELLLGK